MISSIPEPAYTILVTAVAIQYLRNGIRRDIPWWRGLLFRLGVALIVSVLIGEILTRLGG